MYKSIEQIAELQRLYDNGELPPTQKEGLVVNPKVAYEVRNEDVSKCVPMSYLRSREDKYGKISRFCFYTPTDNLLWDFFYFNDISYFRPAAIAFETSERNMNSTRMRPRYTHHAVNTSPWKDFWMEEGRRIIEGYEPIVDGKPCGLRISGEFYFYLNYGRIKKIEKNSLGEITKDVIDFPSFLAMDFYYMKELEARETPSLYGLPPSYKQSLVIVKARRMGFSYKASVGSTYKTAFDRNSLVIIASGTGSDAVTCFNKAVELLGFLSEYTPFGLEDIGSAENNGGWKHARGSVGKKDSGHLDLTIVSTKTAEKTGRKSMIKTVSLFHNDDAISGEGLSRLYSEESGKTVNLSEAWSFAEPAMKVGQMYRNGIAVIFGTGGEMVSKSGKTGSSVGLNNFFYKPSPVGIAGFRNIYEYQETSTECGLFFGALWFYEAPPIVIDEKEYYTIDKNGNPLFWVADIVLNIERKEKHQNGVDRKAYERFLTQYCKTPMEAFLTIQGSVFQSEDLIKRKTDIESRKSSYDEFRVAGELTEYKGHIEFQLKPELSPITPTTITNSDRQGCLLRYRAPRTMKLPNGKEGIPDDAYIISIDPISNNNEGGTSLIAIIVFCTGKYPALGNEGVVATYYGRPKINPVDYQCRLLLKLSRYYNAMVSFENDRGGEAIVNYFMKHNAMDRFLPMPIRVVSTSIKNSKTNLRPFGHAMASDKHKTIGEIMIYEWLDRDNHTTMYFDTETGESITTPVEKNLDRLEDEMLISQLIQYSRDGNYDAVSAFMGILIQMKEIYDLGGKFEIDEIDYRSEGIENMYNKLFDRAKYNK